MRLADRLFWQGRAAWGRSTNNVSPFQTYTEEVGSSRWLVASTLAGRLDLGGWVFRPSVSVAYVEDVAASYVDTFGIAIPEVRSGLGQAKAGPQFDSHYQVSRRIALEPRLGLHVISNFGATTAAGGLGQVDGTNTGPIGTRARGEIGLNTLTTRGFGIDLSGSYDGIGATDYSAFAGRVMVRVPFGP
jgi:outer membrane autotransporter protein